MTKQEYENAVITNCYWQIGDDFDGRLEMEVNGLPVYRYLNEIIIPLHECGFIEGVRCDMFVVQKIGNPSETELVDIDAFMTQNVDMAFCEKILKYL